MAEVTAGESLGPEGARSASAAPYGPSVVDVLVDAVRRSSWHPVLLYVALAMLLVGAEIVVLAVNGTFPDGFQFMHVMLPTYAMVVLPSFHYRNAVAERALADARPVLRLDEQGYEDLHYRLTHLPAGRSILAAFGGLALLGILLVSRPEGADAALGLNTSPGATILESVFQVLTWSGVGITSYHMLHQMWIVMDTYTRHITINLFTPGPLYAFSRLTAANTLFTVGFVAIASVALAPGGDLRSGQTTAPQWIVVAALALALAGASFVAPLWGAHRLLVKEKSRQHDELGRRIEHAIRALEERVDAGDFVAAAELTSVLEGLSTAETGLRRVSSWPWEPETLRVVATGLVIPVVIWAITTGLDTLAS